MKWHVRLASLLRDWRVRGPLMATLLAGVVANGVKWHSVSADPISMTAWVAPITDLTDGLLATAPGVIVTVFGVAGGLFAVKLGWSVLKRFVGR